VLVDVNIQEVICSFCSTKLNLLWTLIRAVTGCTCCSLIVCNLYPFSQTVAARDVAVDDAVEQIDIGIYAFRARSYCLPCITMAAISTWKHGNEHCFMFDFWTAQIIHLVCLAVVLSLPLYLTSYLSGYKLHFMCWIFSEYTVYSVQCFDTVEWQEEHLVQPYVHTGSVAE